MALTEEQKEAILLFLKTNPPILVKGGNKRQ